MKATHDTRRKIRDAARKIIAHKGYERATIKEISEEAGVAFGLLHYHFENKENLFVHVMRTLYDRDMGPALFDAIPARTPAELAAAASETLRQALRSSSDFFRIVYESISVARQSHQVREALQAMWSDYRRDGVTVIDRMKAEGMIRSKLPSAVVLTLLIGVVHGLGIQAMGEPKLGLIDDESIWQGVTAHLTWLFNAS